MNDDDARAALRRTRSPRFEDWFGDNAIRVEYLQVRAVIE